MLLCNSSSIHKMVICIKQHTVAAPRCRSAMSPSPRSLLSCLLFVSSCVKCIGLARDITAPTNLKIPVCVFPLGAAARKSPRTSLATGSPVYRVGGWEGGPRLNEQMGFSQTVFPAQHSQARLISWHPTPTTWVHMCSERERIHIYCTYAASLSCCAWGEPLSGLGLWVWLEKGQKEPQNQRTGAHPVGLILL